MPEYDSRKFPKQNVHFVDQPFRRPAYSPDDTITLQNAYLAAAHCQGCQVPDCVIGCPAGIDIPGFLRRMEARNYAGAARLIREKNPFGEVCGITCAADQLCQKDCYRREFTGMPVRIAELQRWVCAETGEEGWIKSDRPSTGQKVAVIGGGPSALSCAYYLTLAGCEVDVFAQEDRPAGKLWEKSGSESILRTAVERDAQGVISSGIKFHSSGGSKISLRYRGYPGSSMVKRVYAFRPIFSNSRAAHWSARPETIASTALPFQAEPLEVGRGRPEDVPDEGKRRRTLRAAALGPWKTSWSASQQRSRSSTPLLHEGKTPGGRGFSQWPARPSAPEKEG